MSLKKPIHEQHIYKTYKHVIEQIFKEIDKIPKTEWITLHANRTILNLVEGVCSLDGYHSSTFNTCGTPKNDTRFTVKLSNSHGDYMITRTNTYYYSPKYKTPCPKCGSMIFNK